MTPVMYTGHHRVTQAHIHQKHIERALNALKFGQPAIAESWFEAAQGWAEHTISNLHLQRHMLHPFRGKAPVAVLMPIYQRIFDARHDRFRRKLAGRVLP